MGSITEKFRTQAEQLYNENQKRLMAEEIARVNEAASLARQAAQEAESSAGRVQVIAEQINSQCVLNMEKMAEECEGEITQVKQQRDCESAATAVGFSAITAGTTSAYMSWPAIGPMGNIAAVLRHSFRFHKDPELLEHREVLHRALVLVLDVRQA